MKTLYFKISKTLKSFNRLYFYLVGVAALLWFLIRVIPKPSRAGYPCQRLAFPIASGFIIWITVNIISFLGIKKLASYYKEKRKPIAFFACISLVVFYVFWLTFYQIKDSYANTKISNELFVPSDSANTPVGVARGIFPGRVVWAFDTTFSKWTVKSGYWWDSAYTDQAVVSDMVSRSIQQISGKEDEVAAWDTIFKYFNNRHGKGNVGYTAGEKIAIKLSLVQSTNPDANGGNINFTPPQTVLALLRQLVYHAGVAAENITFYDAMRSVPLSVTARCKKEFPKVHFAGSITGKYQEVVKRSTTTVNWSEAHTLEIDGGNIAYLPTIVSEASYIINLANLKGHHMAGITCCSKNHNGSMMADGDVNTPKAVGMHPYIIVHDYTIPGSATWSFKGRDMGTYNAFVDLMGHKDLGEKTLLFIIDGLYSVPSEGVSNSSVLKWQQTPFNNHFSSSIFMSQDNVAIESVALDFFRAEQAINSNIKILYDDNTGYHNVIYGNVDNYLHEAAMADNPVSGTKYAPNGDGVRLISLGVHEHWNNATEKKYSRNLGLNKGIELDEVTATLQAPSSLTIASTANNKIGLSWINGNNDGNIIVYKSINSTTNYNAIATVNGNNTSYEDADFNNNTKVYYRLKRVTDKEFSEYSNEAKATTVNIVNEVVKYSFAIYPNPASQIINLTFSHPATGMANVIITDISGRVIENSRLQKSGYDFRESIDISNFRIGLYFVELSVGNTKFNKSFEVK
jgi:hypothetical protein